MVLIGVPSGCSCSPRLLGRAEVPPGEGLVVIGAHPRERTRSLLPSPKWPIRADLATWTGQDEQTSAPSGLSWPESDRNSGPRDAGRRSTPSAAACQRLAANRG